MAEVHFEDASLPVAVELEAYTPFAPFADRLWGMPVAVFVWRLTNPGTRPVDAAPSTRS